MHNSTAYRPLLSEFKYLTVVVLVYCTVRDHIETQCCSFVFVFLLSFLRPASVHSLAVPAVPAVLLLFSIFDRDVSGPCSNVPV